MRNNLSLALFHALPFTLWEQRLDLGIAHIKYSQRRGDCKRLRKTKYFIAKVAIFPAPKFILLPVLLFKKLCHCCNWRWPRPTWTFATWTGACTCMFHSINIVNLSILNHLNDKDFSSFRVNWNIFVFKLLQIHTRGRSFRFNWNWMRFIFLPNKIQLIASIEFGNRTHRKVPVRLCSITEPIEQQSDRLGSIDFWLVFVRLTTPGVFHKNHWIRKVLNCCR